MDMFVVSYKFHTTGNNLGQPVPRQYIVSYFNEVTGFSDAVALAGPYADNMLFAPDR